MKTLFEDIFQYHLQFNEMIGQQLKDNNLLQGQEMQLYCHLLNAHQIWNARILHQAATPLHQLLDIDACFALNEQNHRETQEILAQRNLEQTIIYENSTGDLFHHSLREILFHISNHHTHHRGQIAFMLRQQNVQPLPTDYIFYKRAQQSA